MKMLTTSLFVLLFYTGACHRIGATSALDTKQYPSSSSPTTGIESAALILWAHSGGGATVEHWTSARGLRSAIHIPNCDAQFITSDRLLLEGVFVITSPHDQSDTSNISVVGINADGILTTTVTRATKPRINFVSVVNGQLIVTRTDTIDSFGATLQEPRRLAAFNDNRYLTALSYDEQFIFYAAWRRGDPVRMLRAVRIDGSHSQELGRIVQQRYDSANFINLKLDDGKSLVLPSRSLINIDLVWPNCTVYSKPTTTFFQYGVHRETRRGMYPVDMIVIPAD